MKERFLRRVHALFLVIFCVTVAVSVFALRTISRSVAGSDWVNHTHSLISELDGLAANLQAGEGMMRTFVFTADPRDFADSRGAFSSLADNLEVAKALAREDPSSAAVFSKLEQIAAQRVALADSLWAAHEKGAPDEVRALLRADSGSTGPADFRREVERLRNRQLNLLGDRDRESFRAAQQTRWVVGTGIAVNLILFLAVAWLVRDDLENRRRMTAALEAANASLEERVKERTAELTQTNAKLAAENLERKWAALSQDHQLRYNQLIVNSVSDLVFVLTKAMNVTRINPAVAHFTGHPEEGVLGRPLSEFVALPDEPGHPTMEGVSRLLRDGREAPACAAFVIDHQGRRRPVKLAVFPLRDNDQVVGGVAVVHPA